jgi:hypothetical protein
MTTTASSGRWPTATRRRSYGSRSEVRRWASSRIKEREESVHGGGYHREQERRWRSSQKSVEGSSGRCSGPKKTKSPKCAASLWHFGVGRMSSSHGQNKIFLCRKLNKEQLSP